MLTAFTKGGARLAADGILDHPLGREYLACFPGLLHGSHFGQRYPGPVEKSPGVFRLLPGVSIACEERWRPCAGKTR